MLLVWIGIGLGTWPVNFATAGQQVNWPVVGPVVSEFDPPDPDWLPGHRGVDLAAAAGTQVRTPREGIVVFAGPVAGVPVVVVRHGTARATYQPVTSAVSVGWPVAAGELLGVTEGLGGHCAGRCLHWGLKINDRYADPRLLLGAVKVVLAPTND